MDNLFTKELEFEKTGEMLYLDRDSSKWLKTIVTAFLQQYPMLQEQPITLSWKKKDTNKGYAVGALHIVGAQVPVVVNQWHASPFDIIMIGGQTYPLNPQILNALMSEASPFKGVVNSGPKKSISIFGEQLQVSPVDVGQTPIKYASFIDKLENVDRKAINTLLKVVRDNPEIKQGFKDNDTFEVVEKLANKKANTLEAAMKSVVRGLDIDRQLVIEDDFGNKLLKQANSAVDHVWTTEVTRDEAEKYTIKTASAKDYISEDKKILAFFQTDDNQDLCIYDDRTWVTKEAAQGQGTGREYGGGASKCVCPKCGNTQAHASGDPCNKSKCSKCGTVMTGMGAPGEKTKEAEKEVKEDEKEVEKEAEKEIDDPETVAILEKQGRYMARGFLAELNKDAEEVIEKVSEEAGKEDEKEVEKEAEVEKEVEVKKEVKAEKEDDEKLASLRPDQRIILGLYEQYFPEEEI